MSFVAPSPKPVGVLSDALRRVVTVSLFTARPFFGVRIELCSTCGRCGEVSSPQRVSGQTEISRPGILLLLPDLPIAETIDDVIVHHSNRLHVRINDRRANEAESPELEVLAECVGFGRSRWNLPRSLPVVRLGSAADETPTVGVEVPEPFLDLEECACVSHCGIDLHPVANDLRIGCETLDFSLGIARDFLGIEFVERAAIPFPLFQNERPVQSRLCA